jgi:hypothetical protein
MMEILRHAIGFAHVAFAICVKHLPRDEVYLKTISEI